MKISENTSVAMPIKNMIGIVIAVAMGVFGYTEVELMNITFSIDEFAIRSINEII